MGSPDPTRGWIGAGSLGLAPQTMAQNAHDDGHNQVIDNKERGCGHLDHNAPYARSDVPGFVVLNEPVEYREYGGGAIIPGWKRFPGMQFARAYLNDGGTTEPEDAVTRYNRRVADELTLDGTHYGDMVTTQAHDLLMSVGKVHWETPQAYIEECRTQGLNLRLPGGPSNEPPTINPGVTRCWVIHPDGFAKGRAGIIGYAVLNRAVYTTGPDATRGDPDVPTYAEDWARTGAVELVTPDSPEPAPDDNQSIQDYD